VGVFGGRLATSFFSDGVGPSCCVWWAVGVCGGRAASGSWDRVGSGVIGKSWVLPGGGGIVCIKVCQR